MPSRDLPSANADSDDLYPLLDELDRLEEILEAMTDLGVSSRADVERRMAELNQRVDELSGG